MNKQLIKAAVERYPGLIIPPFDAIINLQGFEAICEISERLGGGTVYIPSVKIIFKQCLEAEIKRRYTGHNTRELAAEYGYSVNYVRGIVK